MSDERHRPWAVGSTIAGKYVLVRLIGEGGMGDVFEAENSITGRHVAVKLLHPEQQNNREAVGRFLQEARIATRIAHPNIVEVLDAGQEPDGLVFIVQELLQGMDLRRWLSMNGRATPARAVELLTPVTAALAAAHARGVLHRDIKPENIFLARGVDGAVVPKLIDFGVSKILAADGAVSWRTATGRMLGTPTYMPPEQLLAAGGIDGRADVWAIGVVLFELLVGEPPLDELLPHVMLVKLKTEPFPQLKDVAPELPEALTSVVQKALALEVAERTPSAQALHDELEAVYPTLSASASPPGVVPLTRPSRVRPIPTVDVEGAQRDSAPLPPAVSRGMEVTGSHTFPPLEQRPEALSPDDHAIAIEQALAEGRLCDVVIDAEKALPSVQKHAEIVGRLRYAQALAFNWLGDPAQAAWCAGEAMTHLTRGGGRWLHALGEAAQAYGNAGDYERLVAIASELRAAWPPLVTPPLAMVAGRVATQLIQCSWPELAEELLSRVDRGATSNVLGHPLVRARLLRAHGVLARVQGDLSRALNFLSDAAAAFDAASDTREGCLVRAEQGSLLAALGDYAGADRVLREAMNTADALGLYVNAVIRLRLADVLARVGDVTSAIGAIRDVLSAFVQQGNHRQEASARVTLANTLLAQHDWVGAEREANALLEASVVPPPAQRIKGLGALATALLAQERYQEALSVSERAMDQLNATGGIDEGELLVRLVNAKALAVCGHWPLAQRALSDAVQILETRAAAITDPGLRESYLSQVPEHREVRALKVYWGLGS